MSVKKGKSLQEKLKNLRTEIDSADKILIEVLYHRFKAVKKVGKLKKKLGLPLVQKERWEEVVIDRVKRGNKIKLNELFVRAMLRIIHQESVRIQRGKK